MYCRIKPNVSAKKILYIAATKHATSKMYTMHSALIFNVKVRYCTIWTDTVKCEKEISHLPRYKTPERISHIPTIIWS